jgi:hypothetical protein
MPDFDDQFEKCFHRWIILNPDKKYFSIDVQKLQDKTISCVMYDISDNIKDAFKAGITVGLNNKEKNKMAEKLKPCPFCGCEDVEVKTSSSHFDIGGWNEMYVHCNGCGMNVGFMEVSTESKCFGKLVQKDIDHITKLYNNREEKK